MIKVDTNSGWWLKLDGDTLAAGGGMCGKGKDTVSTRDTFWRNFMVAYVHFASVSGGPHRRLVSPTWAPIMALQWGLFF